MKKHNSLWLVVIWLLLVVVAVSALIRYPEQTKLVSRFVEIAGIICCAYVGLTGGVSIRKALHAPVGEYGSEYVPLLKRKEFWVTIIFLFILTELLIFQFVFALEIELVTMKALFYAGVLSAVCVGAFKGTSIAAGFNLTPTPTTNKTVGCNTDAQ